MTPARELTRLREALEEASRLLPEQAPLHAFVHHNTLHAYEHLSFHEALEAASQDLGAEPYPSEGVFARLLAEGTLTSRDIDDELRASPLQQDEAETSLGAFTFEHFVRERLTHLFEVPSADSIRWQIDEDLPFESFSERTTSARRAELQGWAEQRFPTGEGTPTRRALKTLWRALLQAHPTPPAPHRPVPVRRTEKLRSLGAADADHLTHPVLIRLAAAYLDQGLAYWSMPDREKGFYRAVRDLYALPGGAPGEFHKRLKHHLIAQSQEDLSAEEACRWALKKLGVDSTDFAAYLTESLQALRGWAGMFRQLELHPEKATGVRLPVKLIDFTAIALTLELAAVETIWERDERLSSHSLRSLDLLERGELATGRSSGHHLRRTFEAFVLAQICTVDLDTVLHFPTVWVSWIDRVPELFRRKTMLAAYERQYLRQLVDGLSDHVRWLENKTEPSAEYQAVFCIDDREESFRRHLEEVDPGVQTFSYPGFFNVPIRFQGAGEYRSRDLCPVTMKATHRVIETEAGAAVRPSLAPYELHVGSKTLFRGLLLSVVGIVSVVPLVLSVLFPRWFHAKGKGRPEKKTQLLVEAHAHSPQRNENSRQHELPLGFTPQEMSECVERMLREMGLTEMFAPLVFIVGHGSSSINNPHLAAYGCGATAGGCGGPNARVVARMANHPEVRALLFERGISIPQRTTFIGGMHDTCTDDVILDAPEDLNEEQAELLLRVRASFEKAGSLNAQERCRLFDLVDKDVNPHEAKRVVETRAVDLSEPRPEYNHAKNSCCIVGQRKWTRGLFLDQRAFLTSYDPSSDPTGETLTRVLLGSVPVGMGINLEYFFSAIDQKVYGAGSKLPHNVSGLLGVMDGHASDLRTGLYQQMIERHEPVRLVGVVQAPLDVLRKVMEKEQRLAALVSRGWVRLVAWQPEENQLFLFEDGDFVRLYPSVVPLPTSSTSADVYRGTSRVLPLVHIEASLHERTEGAA